MIWALQMRNSEYGIRNSGVLPKNKEPIRGRFCRLILEPEEPSLVTHTANRTEGTISRCAPSWLGTVPRKHQEPITLIPAPLRSLRSTLSRVQSNKGRKLFLMLSFSWMNAEKMVVNYYRALSGCGASGVWGPLPPPYPAPGRSPRIAQDAAPDLYEERRRQSPLLSGQAPMQNRSR